MTPKIQVEIDTDNLMPTYHGFDPDSGPEVERGAPFESLVVDAIARLILERENFEREVRKRVEEIVTEKADEAVTAKVAEVVEQPFQRRSPWGEKIGEETTVREVVRENVVKFFNTKSSRDNFNRSPEGVADMVKNFTRDALDEELKAEVDAVRKKVGVEIRDKALKAAVDAIAPRAY